jgi:uncharacterized protein (TIGR02145 family)
MKSKQSILVSSFALMVLLLIFMSSCSTDDNGTPVSTTVKDIDGNEYHTITIGTQVWMVENLKVTKFRDGTAIPLILNGTTWRNLTTGAYCDYNNNPNNSKIFGRLYNWHVINDSRKLAPTGWHIPSDAEWTTLITYLGGEAIAGGKLKVKGFTYWNEPNTGATNESGFTAYPSGYRDYLALFADTGGDAMYWSSTEDNTTYAYCLSLDDYSSSGSTSHSEKICGLSVRCLKD